MMNQQDICVGGQGLGMKRQSKSGEKGYDTIKFKTGKNINIFYNHNKYKIINMYKHLSYKLFR